MIKSMTGFGQGAGASGETSFRVEVRSVNNRFREVLVKMPRMLMPLEDAVKNLVAEKVARGRVEVFVYIDGANLRSRPSPNLELARDYLSVLRTIKDQLDLPGEPDLAMLAAYRDIIDLADTPPDLEQIKPALEEALDEAVEGLVRMRAQEGERLVADLRERLAFLAEFTEEMDRAAPQVVEAAQQRLKERVETLLGQGLEPERLAQEAAILADKADITEELVRLRSHLTQFTRYLDKGGPVGRKLDFLTQEIHREINTSGVKLNQAELGQRVVEAKAELEKIREQIQNLE